MMATCLRGAGAPRRLFLIAERRDHNSVAALGRDRSEA